jgi:hypothetical protein
MRDGYVGIVSIAGKHVGGIEWVGWMENSRIGNTKGGPTSMEATSRDKKKPG